MHNREVNIAVSPVEHTPWIVRKAVENISVGDYLRVRYPFRHTVPPEELRSMYGAEKMMEEIGRTNGETYDIARPLRFPRDAQALGAGIIVSKLSLETFLHIRQDVLRKVISRAVDIRDMEEEWNYSDPYVRILNKEISLMEEELRNTEMLESRIFSGDALHIPIPH